jgi:hypothetical protein
VIARDDNMTRRNWLSAAITELISGANGSGGPEASMTLFESISLIMRNRCGVGCDTFGIGPSRIEEQR